ncbi:MAG: hypothetical protein MUF54_04810 [Polyangiaceae bacterium]|nr:hypothetical protein [Polyangiaceae bacterium]
MAGTPGTGDDFESYQEDHPMPENIERRKRRSADPIVALHYQLAAIRNDAGLEALVLVDDTGCLVAGAGAWPVCEELAAFAPLLAHRDLPRTPRVADQTAALGRNTHIHAMSVEGIQVLLCARGGSRPHLAPSMDRAAAGCRRILALEA